MLLMILVALGEQSVWDELVESYPAELVAVNLQVHGPMTQHEYRLGRDIAASASVETIKDLRASGILHG
jgi:hypothetical protein